MPKLIGGARFYTVSEVARAAGVHRITLLRWIDAEKVTDGKRDRNGWRMFSDIQLELIRDFALSMSPPRDVPDGQMRLFGRQSARDR